MSKNRTQVKDTVCKTCIFAKYEGTTQMGCSMNMLDNAKNAGVTVLECYDEEKEFYVMPEVQCMCMRPIGWVLNRPKDEWEDAVNKELEIPARAIVLMQIDTTEQEIKRSIADLSDQILKPNDVTVIRPHDNKLVTPLTLANALGTGGFNHWKVENIMDRERLERNAINLVLHTRTHTYTACFRAGKQIPAGFFKTLNDKIIYHFFNFGILTNNNDKFGDEPIHGIVFPHVVWANYGNDIRTLENCLKDDECQDKIFQTRQIIPSFL